MCCTLLVLNTAQCRAGTGVGRHKLTIIQSILLGLRPRPLKIVKYRRQNDPAQYGAIKDFMVSTILQNMPVKGGQRKTMSSQTESHNPFNFGRFVIGNNKVYRLVDFNLGNLYSRKSPWRRGQDPGTDSAPPDAGTDSPAPDVGTSLAPAPGTAAGPAGLLPPAGEELLPPSAPAATPARLCSRSRGRGLEEGNFKFRVDSKLPDTKGFWFI